MNNSYLIRRAKEEDFLEITVLYRESFQLHHKAHPKIYKATPKYPLYRGTFINMLEDKNELMLVAENAGQVVGFINASIEKDDSNYMHQAYRRVSVDDLCVSQNERRHGIGKKLMHSAEKWAAEKGIDELTMIVYNFNKIAMLFYESQSYRPISTRLTKYI